MAYRNVASEMVNALVSAAISGEVASHTVSPDMLKEVAA